MPFLRVSISFQTNILIDKYGDVKVTDFGLSTQPLGTQPNPCRKPYQDTLQYASPEVILTLPCCEYEIDIWAMGVILYSLLVGNLPFDDRCLKDLEMKILVSLFFIFATYRNSTLKFNFFQDTVH